MWGDVPCADYRLAGEYRLTGYDRQGQKNKAKNIVVRYMPTTWLTEREEPYPSPPKKTKGLDRAIRIGCFPCTVVGDNKLLGGSGLSCPGLRCGLAPLRLLFFLRDEKARLSSPFFSFHLGASSPSSSSSYITVRLLNDPVSPRFPASNSILLCCPRMFCSNIEIMLLAV